MDLPVKTCSRCSEVLPGTLEHFSPAAYGRFGLKAHCKKCVALSRRDYYAKNPAVCIARSSALVKKRRAENPEYDRTLSREQKRKEHADSQKYQEHLKRGREWRKANPEAVKKFAHSAPAKRADRTARRNARLKQAVPPWADLAAIAAVYVQAQRLQAETGVPHHVDHDVPLQGKTVCGLHTAENLRAITAELNQQKSNRFIA